MVPSSPFRRSALAAGSTLFLLFLGACGADETAPPAEERAGASDPALDLESIMANASAGEAARLQEVIARVMPAVLPGAKDAQYRNVRSGVAGAVCGEVNATPDAGDQGYRGFVITPEGLGVLARSQQLTFGDPTDYFPDLYLRWCATPEEIERLAPEMERAIARSAGAAAAAPVPEVPPIELPPEPSSAPPAAQSQPAPPPPKSEIGSFSDAVRRKQQ